MDNVELTGNWRVKAYTMHEQPKINAYKGYIVNPEPTEELLNPFGSDYPTSVPGGIRPEDVPLQPKLPLGDPLPAEEFSTSDLDELRNRILQPVKDSMSRLPEPQPYELDMSLILQDALELFLRKNAEYGNAIEYTGLLGSIVAMTGDIARLRVMVLHRSGDLPLIEFGNVQDKLLDILVQAAIGIMMLQKDNLTGV